MATFDLPMPITPLPSRWFRRYTLEGARYWFFCDYNDRAGFWYLSVSNDERAAQVYNIKLNIGVDKLSIVKYADVPPGSLDVVDRVSQTVEPSLTDFGDRVILRYTEFVAPVPPATVIPLPDVDPG